MMTKESDHYGRFRANVAQAKARAEGLEAAGIALKLLTGGQTVTVGDMPLQDLVAKELGLPNPDRIAAHREVEQRLKIGGEAVALALEGEEFKRVNALQMLPQSERDVAVQEQIH